MQQKNVTAEIYVIYLLLSNIKTIDAGLRSRRMKLEDVELHQGCESHL